MKDIYKVAANPQALQENQIVREHYRITMLTEGLVRLEYSQDGSFEDQATQVVWHRDFPKTDFRVNHTADGIEIHTSRIHLIYNEKEFSSHGLSIQIKGNFNASNSFWHYGEELHDLRGTARTLDEANGAIELEHGILSRFGYALLDDSRSQVLLENGWLMPRKKGIQDIYFFGYGHDYKEALKAFYHLCGKTPMVPRYALGNWWSRYYAYSEESYLALMERFDKEQLPFTVAVIDMDWHLVDIDPRYGSGWTGYTWNRELFPDPERFLKKLHDRGMRITLNVHPADGVRAYEERYQDMARAMGVDDTKEDPVNCDPASPEYMENYFTYLHHPREKEGVDFWWIDWQQGSNCKVEGLDPLWIMNHFHFLDSARNGKRPITFSRYGGPGSHRYPVGFSGDTIITWESLDFQPYFTANASNIGYGWWSHDIGGHMQGYKDDELTARWTQFGIYSPIMRLHSTKSEFNGKEPWRFKGETRQVMGEALRERHRMIPYLYSMNYRNYREDLPVICPMYYECPEENGAYEARNQYFFGSELIAAPITAPRIKGLNVAPVTVWLPEGIWYDIYTGMIYEGGRTLVMYRTLESIPVLARAGGIVPFTREISAVQAVKNPDSLWIRVYGGADGSFLLYEDDNETCGYQKGLCVITRMTYREGERAVFVVEPAQGDGSLIPEKRDYVVEFTGFSDTEEGRTECMGLSEAESDQAEQRYSQVQVKISGQPLSEDQVIVSYRKEKQAVEVCLKQVDTDKELEISLDMGLRARGNVVEERIFDFLNQAEIEFGLKDELYRLIRTRKSVPVLLGQMSAMGLEKELYGVLAELLTAWKIAG